MDPDSSQGLEAQVIELRQRVRELEQALLSRGILQPQVETRPVPEQAAAKPEPTPQPTPAPEFAFALPPNPPPVFPSFASHYRAQPEDSGSLESRIGSQWFNRVGILAVLIGMAWFLKFAIDNHWIGPLGRVLIGLIVGGGLVAWSERFRRSGYALFSYTLKAIGTGV